MNIFEHCNSIENNRFLVRLLREDDATDLLKVYSDKLALPFFNSDGCDGDIFYYPTKERMDEAMRFWKYAYENGWFVRLSIIDKTISTIIGTIELCMRVSKDSFDGMIILRVDVRSDYEEQVVLIDIFSLAIKMISATFVSKGVFTKAPIYAVERIKSIKQIGFIKSKDLLFDKNGFAYDGYWEIK